MAKRDEVVQSFVTMLSQVTDEALEVIDVGEGGQEMFFSPSHFVVHIQRGQPPVPPWAVGGAMLVPASVPTGVHVPQVSSPREPLTATAEDGGIEPDREQKAKYLKERWGQIVDEVLSHSESRAEPLLLVLSQLSTLLEISGEGGIKWPLMRPDEGPPTDVPDAFRDALRDDEGGHPHDD